MASTGYDGIAKANPTVPITQQPTLPLCWRSIFVRLVIGPVLITCQLCFSNGTDPDCVRYGKLTRTGDCVAHPRMGFRNKVAAVTTDLPLVPDKPIDFGMLDFCRVCRKCSENCPGEAISFDEEPVKYNGYLRWNSDFRKCAASARQSGGFSCGRCVKVCPWSSKEDSWFHEAGVWIGSKGKQSASLLKQIDDMFGYGTEEITKYKWWLEWPELFPMPAGYPPTQTTQPSK